MRMLSPLLFAIVVLAFAAPAQAEPTWANPVTIYASTGLGPGSTVSCFGNPSAGGQLVSAAGAVYAWTLDGVALPGATAREYTVRNADLGHTRAVR
jgi:hypothetical protein